MPYGHARRKRVKRFIPHQQSMPSVSRTSRQKLDNEYELIPRASDSRFRHLPTAVSYNFAAVGKAMSIYYLLCIFDRNALVSASKDCINPLMHEVFFSLFFVKY